MSPRDLRFLVVDDSSTMRRIIRGLLKEMGCDRIEEAQDGVDALRALLESKFDVVVTDINMPNMNGLDLLSEVRADASLRHLPVLMVTAESRKEDIVRAARSGASAYIVKPFTRGKLEEELQKVMRKLETVA